MTKTETRWKFLRQVDNTIKSDHGDETWNVGEWKRLNGAPELCEHGYHCSQTITQALFYVPGEILALVEVGGLADVEEDKEVYTEMRIVKAYHWTKTDSIKLAIYAAEQVIEIFEHRVPDDDRPRKAIEAAKAYLATSSDGAARTAANAARAAARAADAAAYAARAAAYAAYAADAADAANAAYGAARAAATAANAAYATNAARAAARAADAAAYAARAAAYAADANNGVGTRISEWLEAHVSELEEIH